MADLAAIADRVYRGILAPLVLGGEMIPGKPIGVRVALEIGILRGSVDPDLTSHVTLGRIRRARQLAPVDRFEDATVAEWSLACALHDLLQAAHPSFAGAFRSQKTTSRLLTLVDSVCARTPPPESVGEALSRHSWFARTLEIARTDSTVSWWVGKSKFLGVTPPARLTAWPELRRVHVNEERRSLIELPTHGGAVDALKFASSLSAILAKTPLTDVATCARTWPIFAWRAESLALLATHNGRTLALRALSREPEIDVDVSLGTATREFAKRVPSEASGIVFAFLGERALASALGPSSTHDIDRPRNARLARAAGAIAARALVTAPDAPYSSDTRAYALRALERMAANVEGAEIAPLVAAATQTAAAATSAISR